MSGEMFIAAFDAAMGIILAVSLTTIVAFVVGWCIDTLKDKIRYLKSKNL